MNGNERQRSLGFAAEDSTSSSETLREEITALIEGSGAKKAIAFALFGSTGNPQNRLTRALLGEETFLDVDHLVPALRLCSPAARSRFVRTLLRLLELDVAGGRIVQSTAATAEERLAALEESRRETLRRLSAEVAEEAEIRKIVKGRK